MAARKKAQPDPAPLPSVELAQVAYETYSAAVTGVSVHGDALPSWRDQLENTPHVANAWRAAAEAVIAAATPRRD